MQSNIYKNAPTENKFDFQINKQWQSQVNSVLKLVLEAVSNIETNN